MRDRKPVVLFLCTGNTARSQMAEALLRHHAGDRFDARSAGLRPKDEVHPLTIRVLAEIGIDTAPLHPKGVQFFMKKVSIHHAIIVCESVQQHCPRICPFALHTHYWPFEDPASFVGTDEERLDEFRRVREQIEDKLFAWLEVMVGK